MKVSKLEYRIDGWGDIRENENVKPIVVSLLMYALFVRFEYCREYKRCDVNDIMIDCINDAISGIINGIGRSSNMTDMISGSVM